MTLCTTNGSKASINFKETSLTTKFTGTNKIFENRKQKYFMCEEEAHKSLQQEN